ncbi:MAG TPA: hypothetical protein VK694_07930 [Verrucomicrobiae bacterium]|nr:hypothetical protein [Verrucomicrobiae bacterium]
MKLVSKQSVLAMAILVVTFFFGVIFVSVQQALRLGANEPQGSMAQDVAKELNLGRKPQDLFKDQVDIGSNMAPFVIVYDKYGKVVAGSGYLDGTIPEVPVGVLAAAKGNKVNKVTWQPNERVRIASVSREADNYYVLGGRSLAVVERKITSFTRWLIAAWLLSLAAAVGIYRLSTKPAQKKSKPTITE